MRTFSLPLPPYLPTNLPIYPSTKSPTTHPSHTHLPTRPPTHPPVMIYVDIYAVLSVPCSLVITCWERASCVLCREYSTVWVISILWMFDYVSRLQSGWFFCRSFLLFMVHVYFMLYCLFLAAFYHLLGKD